MRARTPSQASGSTAAVRTGDTPRREPSWRVTVLVGMVALAAYGWLAPAVSGDRDSSEFTLVLALDGIAHPTGYPLYTLFGHAFVSVARALGANWAFAANLWSALGGAVALALLHALATRLIPATAPLAGAERILLPLVPVALLLFNPAWTQVTTVAEVYSWHQAWVMAMAVVCVTWCSAAGDDRSPRGPGLARAAAWGLLAGAGLAHHATSLLVVVPLAVAMVAAARPTARWGRAGLAAAGAAGLMPLAGALLLRAKSHHPGPAQWSGLEDSWTGLWVHLTGAQYGGAFGRFAPEPMDRRLLETALFPFLFPGLVALAVAWRVTPRGCGRTALAGLLAAAVVQCGFAFLYGVDDPSAYFLPALAFALAGAVPALAALAAAGRSAHAAARAVTMALAAAAVSLSVPWASAALELRATLTGLDGLLHSTWATIPVDRGLVLWPHDMHQRLREYQLLKGERPRLDIVNPWRFTDPVARRRFAARYGFDPVGDLRLAREDLLAPGAATPGARGFLARVAERIDAHTDLPVIVFEPEVPRARLLPKAGRR